LARGRKILAMRFSAMGDVAMVAPVLKEMLQHYPDTKITFVSRPQFAAFFESIPGVTFYGVDLEKYKGFFGLRKLYKELSTLGNFDGIADLHDVLRTKILRGFFKFKRIKISVIGKGRTAKRKLTRKKSKRLKPLKFTVQRYADVFYQLGFPFELENRLRPNPQPLGSKVLSVLGQKRSNWIGIAPFAKHKAKRMPFSKAEGMIEELRRLPKVRILLFGGGKAEKSKLEEIESQFNNVYSIAGKLTMQQELDLISQLDVMVSMDSANMHLASMMGIPVVSIWGATHPFSGFLGYGQSITNTVQHELACRPCSTFGNKPCFRGDYACMTHISTKEILTKVTKFLT